MSFIVKGYADTRFGQIHYRRVDGPDPPLVLLHRTPVSSASFDAVLTLLQGRRAAIALDTPGFGESFQPAGVPNARDYAIWFLAAFDSLGADRFHLFGHHTGTHFAAEIASLASDRVLSLSLSGVLYATAEERAAMRREIGDAPPIDEQGDHIVATWSLIKSFFRNFSPDLVQTEFLGALGAPVGRNQAFTAILDQDFASLLARLRQPIQIVQAKDDPLAGFLDRVRAAHPAINVSLHDAAGIAAPELQPVFLAQALLAFASSHDVA